MFRAPMRRLSISIAMAFVALANCQKSADDKSITPVGSGSGAMPTDTTHGSGAGRPRAEQIAPPVDLKNPPAEAIKTASGLIYKKLVTRAEAEGVAAKRNDTVLINYTGWKPSTGETFFSNRSRGQPMPLNLASSAKGFTEAMQLMRKGEKVVLWMPPELGSKGPPQEKPETLVYEIEVVDILAAPEVPADLKDPPATASTTKSGAKYVSVKPGTGKERARSFDTVTFNYTAWDAEGRMFDSTETRKRPATVAPFKQSLVMEEILTSMVEGDRTRFWIDAEKMTQGGRPLPGQPKGVVCYEIELLKLVKGTPPPAPPTDVAKPPAGALKACGTTPPAPAGSGSGSAAAPRECVSYKVLSTGKGGPKPKPTETVKVHYTGWTTDGRMFDSSVVKGEPAEFALNGVIAGWTEGIPVMSVGDKVRFWIPEQLAYKGAPGRPQGMLVFDVELLEIKAAVAHPDGPPAGAADPKAPADVAKPPGDAKHTEKGVFYKVLTAGKGGPKPTPQNTVKVHYSGWTTDGKLFDSSVKRGQPAEFPLGGVIAGWTDGLQVMSVGDKVRFWIPEELAYKGSPGKPQGMLVFDVELLEIK